MQRNIEIELIECGKTVFIAQSDEIEAEYNFLKNKYPWHKFYKGKEILRESFHGVIFRLVRNLKLPFYYKSLVETGIQGRVEQEVISRAHFSRKPASNEHPMIVRDIGLDGAFSTFIIIWSVAVVASLPAFVFEIRFCL